MLFSTYLRYDDAPDGQKCPAWSSFQCFVSQQVTHDAYQSELEYFLRIYSLIIFHSLSFKCDVLSCFFSRCFLRFSFAISFSHFFVQYLDGHHSFNCFWQTLQNFSFTFFTFVCFSFSIFGKILCFSCFRLYCMVCYLLISSGFWWIFQITWDFKAQIFVKTLFLFQFLRDNSTLNQQ